MAAAARARATLRLTLKTLLRLFAPFLPYSTEEVWSWWQEGSVHRQAWPSLEELRTDGDPTVLGAVGQALAGVRKAKSDAKMGMRAEVSSVTFAGPAEITDRVRAGEADLRAAGKITALQYADGETFEVRDAELIPPPPKTPAQS